MDKVLENIRVLDLTTWLAGPYCCMQLADMGADVIRIDPPVGSMDRAIGPFTPHGDSIQYAICTQRNKRNITLDFTNDTGREILAKLVKESDVIVHNFVQGTKQAEILSYESLKHLRTDIIVAKISGYGHSGPYATRVAFDATGQAESGGMSLTGFPGSPPVRTQINYVDFGTGLHTALAVMYALYYRQKTGIGQEIEVALFDVAVSFAATQGAIAEYRLYGTIRPQLGNHGYMAFGDTYKTKDGWITVNIGSDAQWRRFVRTVGKEEWVNDLRFKTNADRFFHRDIYTPVYQQWMVDRTNEEVIRVMEKARVPCGVVNRISEVANHPQAKFREMLVEVDYPPDESKVVVSGVVPKLSKSAGRIEKRPPTLGENNREIYCNLLGLTQQEYEGLESRKVI
jgi:CoA:oxalate CoA-transferase